MVLFDEIEKAHPEVFNLLLQILDDGRLTDGHGRTVDFKNTVIIMTSNIGTEYIQQVTEQNFERVREQVITELRRYFKPEFLNRVDDIIIFRSLTKEHIFKIIDIQLARIQKRLEERKLGLELSQPAKEFLAEVGYDPQFGARPLRRAIEKHLLDPLAKEILEGKYLEGDTIWVDADEQGLIFQKKAEESSAQVAN